MSMTLGSSPAMGLLLCSSRADRRVLREVPSGVGSYCVVSAYLPPDPGAKHQEVDSHRMRKRPHETTRAASANEPHRLSATSARRDHQADRQPRPVATAASTRITA